MADLVPKDEIESIVGAARHRSVHIGRAVSSEQTVYVLHSQSCLDSTPDLLECRFSVALDRGINMRRWEGHEDKAVVLGIWLDDLIPCPGALERRRDGK